MEEVIKERLLLAILEDEYEACFDRSYCSDISWRNLHGDTDRVTAFLESMEYFNKMSVGEIADYFGDKYDYIILNNS